jgi:hypothetical protein
MIARNLSDSLLPSVIKVYSRHPLEHKLELNFLLRMVLPLRAISFVMHFFAQASSQRTKG